MLELVAAAAVAAAANATPQQSIRVLAADGAAVSIEIVGPQGARVPNAVNPTVSRPTERMPNLYQIPARCRDVPYHIVDQYGRPLPARLGDLPRAGALQLLVDRQIDGCRVITVKQGVVARDQPNPPPQSYRIRPLDKPSGPATPPKP